jgi:nicotinate phosphoribosyltransferase
MRQLRIRDLERLDVGVRRLINPHIYHVSLSQRLWDLKQDLVAQAVGGRGNSSGPPQPA